MSRLSPSHLLRAVGLVGLCIAGPWPLLAENTIKLVAIPAGVYEHPFKQEIQPFWLGETEVTQAQYQAVMGRNPAYFVLDNGPVDSVSWYEALEFCNALSQREGLTPVYTLAGSEVSVDPTANGYRLPTQLEWEWAAVGAGASKNYRFSGSDDARQVACYEKTSAGRPQGVAQLAPNELGLYDMSGNLWEWCWDPLVAASPEDGSPKTYRINRGGSWHDFEADLRPVIFNYSYPEFQGIDLGFRVARNAD